MDEEYKYKRDSMLKLAEAISYQIFILANNMKAGSSAIYRKNFGIGMVEWRTMALIALETRVQPGRVCEVLGIDKAAVSRSVATLKELGLVQVNPLNGRDHELTLTRKGMELHDRIVPVALERERRFVAPLTDAEISTLRTLLGRIVDNIGRLKAPLDISELEASRASGQRKRQD